jgi:hypothetical protein
MRKQYSNSLSTLFSHNLIKISTKKIISNFFFIIWSVEHFFIAPNQLRAFSKPDRPHKASDQYPFKSLFFNKINRKARRIYVYCGICWGLLCHCYSQNFADCSQTSSVEKITEIVNYQFLSKN